MRPPPARPGVRLGARIALMTGAGFLALAAGLVLASSRHFLGAHEEAIGREQVLLVSTAAEGLEDAIDLARRSLTRAADGVPPSLLADPGAARIFLEGKGALRALFEDGLALLDAGERVVATTAPADRHVRGRSLDVPPVPAGRLVSSPYPSAADRARPAVAMRVAIRDRGGAIVGFLHGGIDLHDPSFLGRLARSRIGQRGFFAVVTAERTILLHADPGRVLGPARPPGTSRLLDDGLAGHEGWAVMSTRAGVEVIAAARRVPSTGWLVVANYPLDEARAPFLRARTAFLGVALAAAAALLAAVLVTARRLTRPLAAMTAQVEALAEGRGDVRPVTVASRDEVGTLARAFNRLLEQRGQAQARLRASEERFRLAFRMNADPLTLARLDDGVFVAVNQGFELVHGLREADVIGRSGRELGVWVDPAERLAIVERVRREGSVRDVDVRVRGAGGRELTVAFSGTLVPIDGVDHLFALARDVTEKRRAEAARKTSEVRAGMLERLAATGQLAAGVAHEINNPLTYVLSNLDEALAELRAGGAAEAAERVAEARDGAERVRAIVGDLRVFARADGEEPGACDAAAVARSAAQLVQNEIRHRARLVTRFEPAPPARIAERRLAQVLVNLLVNACQAMPEGRAAENELRLAVREEGGRVLVEVSDTGAGMTEEVRRRIFEPFFTTRPVGEGMGLGLAMSHGMVAEAGGELEVESAPGKGSTFRIRLPAGAPLEQAAAPLAEPPPAPAACAAEPAAPRLRVLLVDDEPLVARAVARVLRDFDVDLETSAAGALARVRSGAPYDAVVCDLMMPDATGMDLHARVAEGDRAIAARFVFLTGGAFTERARAFVATTTAPVLEKPVDPAALRAAVRAAAAARDVGAPV